MKKYSRASPYHSRVKERKLLTGASSTKKTYHIVLDTSGWDESYRVGDSIAILPSNDPKEVDLILQKIGSRGDEIVFDPRSNLSLSIRDFLTYRANLARVNRSFFSLLGEIDPAFLQTHTMRELLSFGSLTLPDLVKTAMPLLPRFYSIANAASVFPDELHLLVSYVQYHVDGQERRGVGSHFLCDLAEIGSTPVPLYVQPSQHFSPPTDPASSMIMVGPGTGVAPYRAFMQERLASHATGRHWLFFGERNRETDFYYESFWTDLEKQGRLRLDLAFSRDQESKVYVQNKMYERRKSLWQWIQEGAFVYVCGDAEKMAKEVDAVIHQIIEEEGKVDAQLYVKKMRQEKRYLVDVY